MDNKQKLNKFFVSCFYSILNAEERAMEGISNGTLSLKEIHVIEAVFKAKLTNENNFSFVSQLLGVTLGTLTVAFTRLQKKGYLYKKQHKDDKRVYYIEPTRLAELVNEQHADFHKKMIDGIAGAISKTEFKNLVNALEVLDNFFKKF